MNNKILGFILTAIFASSSAVASIITFDPLAGANGSSYAGHTESGFTVANDGDWLEAHNFGTPVPSIFTQSSTDSISITETGSTGFFTFAGIDMACNNGSDCSYSIEGFLNSVSVLNLVGSVTAGPPFQFYTVATGGPSTVLDYLSISMTDAGSSSMNIDNINVSATTSTVSEPAALSLLMLGISSLLLGKRRRKIA
ncbi:MAG: PEP-CTERM sorting domain-containing protein [Oleiphilus sp.]